MRDLRDVVLIELTFGLVASMAARGMRAGLFTRLEAEVRLGWWAEQIKAGTGVMARPVDDDMRSANAAAVDAAVARVRHTLDAAVELEASLAGGGG